MAAVELESSRNRSGYQLMNLLYFGETRIYENLNERRPKCHHHDSQRNPAIPEHAGWPKMYRWTRWPNMESNIGFPFSQKTWSHGILLKDGNNQMDGTLFVSVNTIPDFCHSILQIFAFTFAYWSFDGVEITSRSTWPNIDVSPEFPTFYTLVLRI
jgi:hypothetical protein